MKFFIKIRLKHLIIVGFFLRLITCLIYYWGFAPYELKPIVQNQYQGIGTDGYFQIARTLWLSGEYAFEVGGQPVHSRPPLQPLLLLITSAWSDHYWFFQWFIVSSLLGTTAIFLVYQLTIRFSNVQNALCASAMVAFHPYLVIIARSTTFVHLGTVLLLATFYIYFHYKYSLTKYILLGFFCGLCLLTHGTFQILPLTFAILLAYKKKFLEAILVIIFTLMTVFPWTIRNYFTFQKPIFLVTGMGMQFWKGEESAFRSKVDIYRKVYEENTGKKLQIAYFCTIDPEDDQLLWKLGLKKIEDKPFEFIQRFLYGIIIFLFPHETGWQKFIFTFLCNFPLFLAAILKPKKYWQKEIALYLALVILVFAFFTPHAGYIVMFLPLITLFLV
jgi:4-amino-4-deoxy-L-arabinose transferase-like glycosyltransferase